jgi:hypothetical protein
MRIHQNVKTKIQVYRGLGSFDIPKPTVGLRGYGTLEQPTRWLKLVKKIVCNINDHLTDGELVNDMFKLNWTPEDVLTYMENNYE